jgi:putative SOS response-associated peptidase YedK
MRTFAVVTCPANDFVAQIHDRMLVILDAADYERWLGDEPDPRDLSVPFPSNAAILEPVDDATLI